MPVPLFRLLAATAVATYASTAAAGDDDCLQGSWEGTLGTATVSLEFRPEYGSDGLAGRYYYDRRLADLLLTVDPEDPEHLQERDAAGQVTGRWMYSCSDTRLGGTWQSPDGHRTLSLTATRSDGFDRRRLDALAPTASPRRDAQGNAYTALAVPGVPEVASLQLPGASPGIARINATLLASLREDVGRALECSTFGRLRGADAGWSHHSETTVAAWAGDTVSLRVSSEGYCGGAHPYGDTGYLSFRLSDGEAFHPSSWLVADYGTRIERASPLGAELERRYRAERDDDTADECLDGLDFFPDSIALDPAGLRFPSTVPYVARPCEQDVVIDFEALRPFLSEAGRQAVARMHGSAGTPSR